jgi:hypothetical protein
MLTVGDALSAAAAGAGMCRGTGAEAEALLLAVPASGPAGAAAASLAVTKVVTAAVVGWSKIRVEGSCRLRRRLTRDTYSTAPRESRPPVKQWRGEGVGCIRSTLNSIHTSMQS